MASYEQIIRNMSKNKDAGSAPGKPQEPVANDAASESTETLFDDTSDDIQEKVVTGEPVAEELQDKEPEHVEQVPESVISVARDAVKVTDQVLALGKEPVPSVVRDDGPGEPPVSVMEEVPLPPVMDTKKMAKPYNPEVESKNVDKRRKKSGRPRIKKSDNEEKETLHLMVSKELVAMCRGQIPEALNNSDAVAAWIYAKSDKTVDVPDYIKKIALSYAGDQTTNILKDINENLAAMRTKSYNLQLLTDGRIQELWYMLAYLMLERMDEIHSPQLSKMDFGIPVFDTLQDMTRSQAMRERNRKANSRKNRYTQ